MMSNPLQQTIEALAKEKGIEPDVVISAIEDAVATASRKYYKTGENLKTRFNPETGQVDLFAVKQIVEEVDQPGRPRSRSTKRADVRALRRRRPKIELGDEIEFPKPTEVLGRIAAQTAKQVIFQKVREAERENIFAEYNQRDRRGGQRHGQALRERRHHRRDRPHRGGAAAQGTVARRELHARRPRARGHQGREPQRQGTADRPVAHRPGAAHQAVRAGSAGDLRRHGDDPRRGPRGGRPREGRRLLARARRRSGRRLRRHEGHARAVDHPRAARREDRHRRVVRGPGRVRHQRAQPGEGAARVDRRRPRARDGSGRRGQAAVAGHRQEGPERPARGQADRLAHRHQERGREAPRGRGAVRRARSGGRRSADDAEATADGADDRRGRGRGGERRCPTRWPASARRRSGKLVDGRASRRSRPSRPRRSSSCRRSPASARRRPRRFWPPRAAKSPAQTSRRAGAEAPRSHPRMHHEE